MAWRARFFVRLATSDFPRKSTPTVRRFAIPSPRTGGIAMVPLPQPQTRRIFVVALLAALTAAPIIATVGGGPGWGMIGNDSANSRSAEHERTIGPENVGQLKPKWIAPTSGDVSGTPVVAGGDVYFGDFGGTIRKLDADTGNVIWMA